MRSTAWFLVLICLSGCVDGSDGGGPKRYGSGVHDIDGTCTESNDIQEFRIDSEAGTFEMSVSWDDSDGEDIDLYVEDPDDDEGLFEYDDDLPPNDSPAEVTAVIPAPMNLVATVDCYDWPVPYSAQMTVP